VGGISIARVKEDHEVTSMLEAGNEHLGTLGFTEHGLRHANLVSRIANNILSHLGYPKEDQELAELAGYLHDIGNVVSRCNHGQVGALLAGRILARLGVPAPQTATVMGAIGNHEEEHGQPVNTVAAALILADKSDVHRTRVRNPEVVKFDIHDRVNYAAEKSFIRVDPSGKKVTLELEIDTSISPVMDYFEIFLTRMVMCRRAASFLGCRFELLINDVKLL